MGNELRQCTAEVDKLKATRETKRADLAGIEHELKLEQDAVASMQQLCAQASKALTVHTRERDRYKLEAERARQHVAKLKDRVEELAYKVRRAFSRRASCLRPRTSPTLDLPPPPPFVDPQVNGVSLASF